MDGDLDFDLMQGTVLVAVGNRIGEQFIEGHRVELEDSGRWILRDLRRPHPPTQHGPLPDGLPTPMVRHARTGPPAVGRSPPPAPGEIPLGLR